MKTSRLNALQRLMRQWDTLHPYNAAQVLRVQGQPDHEDVVHAWSEALGDLGLGPVRIRGRNFRFDAHNRGVPGRGVRVVPRGVALDDFISEELNRAFGDPGESPFRPFVREGEGSTTVLGVVYHHWIADSVSIRLLLGEWFLRLFDPARARRTPIQLVGAEDSGVSGGGRPRVGPLGQGLLTAARWIAEHRRCARVLADPYLLASRFSLRSTPPGLLDRLVDGARRRGVSINDLLVSALARVADRFVALRRRPKRRDIALAEILDLRPGSRGPGFEAFGALLGIGSVVCPPEVLGDPEALLRVVRAQHGRHRLRGGPRAGHVYMLAGLSLGRWFTTRQLTHHYQTHVPVAAGLSNVNLNRAWISRYHPAPLIDYIRVSPTGPLAPLMLSVSTLGRAFNLGVTYRPSVIAPDRIDELAVLFIEALEAYASPSLDGGLGGVVGPWARAPVLPHVRP